uniref:Uncharacterized protein n=1 Tax=Dicentrarchus labrax TaxID=13489 RepID=E6ZHE0_DICLA|nr:Uncharacterized protein [Dicentrarchus labrax]
MKTVILAFLVLLVVSQGEALICKCGGQRYCSHAREVCFGVCARVVQPGACPAFYQGCMRAVDCMAMIRPGISNAHCCSTDLCNVIQQ